MILKRNQLFQFERRIQDIPLPIIVWCCVTASVLFAIRVMGAQNGWITDDSVLYLEVARLFSIGQWKAGLRLYNWPLYPALIQTVNTITGLGLQTSAQCLAVFLFALTTYYFCSLIVLCGGDRQAVVFGTLILLGSPYIVGDVLPMLIRDHGFWAFFLAGLNYFIRFCQTGQLYMSLLWQSSMILAALFRVEGFVFVALLPLSLLVNHRLEPRRLFARLLSCYFLSISILILSLIAVALQIVNVESLGRLKDLINPDIYLHLLEKLETRADVMAKQVLGEFLDDYAITSLLTALFLILIAKTLASTGWATIALWLIEHRKNYTSIHPVTKVILFWAIGIASINAVFILLKEFVLSGRYIISISLILMVIASIGVQHSFLKLKNQLHRDRLETFILSGAALLLMFNLIHNLMPMKPGYNYEQEAVEWVKQQTAESDKVFYVSPRARFYAGAAFSGRDYDYAEQVEKAIQTKTIYEYDYLVINLNRDQNEQQLLEQLPEYQMVKVFEGVKGRKKIFIFIRKDRSL